MRRTAMMVHAIWMSFGVIAANVLLAGFLTLYPTAAFAGCSPVLVVAGSTVDCGSGTYNGRLGGVDANNQGTVDAATIKVTPDTSVSQNAVINSGNQHAIILRNGAVGGSAISIGTSGNETDSSGAQAIVTSNVTTNASDPITRADINPGRNTIQIDNNYNITVWANGQVHQTGTATRAEAINVLGTNNTITNYGLIQNDNSNSTALGAAIWFQDITVDPALRNTIDNFGTIRVRANRSVIGSSSTTAGAGSVTFTNETGARVEGNILFASGNDILQFFPNSVVTGNIDGGAGTNALLLNGNLSSYDTLPGALTNFTTLTKTGDGQWDVTGSLTGFTAVTVQQGTLGLTGNNAGYTGMVVVNPLAVLEARAQSLPTSSSHLNNVTDDGIVRFTQNDNGTYAGQITGNGAVEKTGTGVTTLAPVTASGNTYLGGTAILQGGIAVGADSALGGTNGPLTLNGGFLQLNANMNLAAARAITVGLNNGAIDTQGFTSTVSQGITGLGTLTKFGMGTLTLEGVSSYRGGTNIAAGEVVVGDSAHAGAALSGGGPVIVNTGTILAGYGSVTGNVLNNGTIAVASALPAFSSGPGGNFTVNGNLTGSGLLRVGGNATAPGNSLVVNGNYIGDNGLLGLRTYLGTDGSPSDLLVIRGGTATGLTTIRISNAGGPGLPTYADGIRVVQATNGATTLPTAFTLSGVEIRGGAFDYALFRGGVDGISSPDDWFLRNEFLIPGAPGPSPVPPGPDLPIDPPPDVLPPGEYPIIGPELASYGVVQPMARQLGASILGTLHDRIGDTLLDTDCSPDSGSARDDRVSASGCDSGGLRPSSAWARVFGQRIDNRYHAFAEPGTSGQIWGFQSGLDLWRDPGTDGHRDTAGIYLSYANANASISGLVTDLAASNYAMQHTGRINLDAWSGGAYWTHYGPRGWYLDAVTQLTRYDGTVHTQFTRLDTVGSGFIASLETGYPVSMPVFGPGFVLEPQAQILWQRVEFNSANDGLGDVAPGTTDGTTGRIGLRGRWTFVTAQGLQWQPYLRANYWRDWSARATTVYGGFDHVPLRESAKRVEVGAGISVKMNTAISVYANADYQFAVDDSDGVKRDGVRGTLGVRYTW